MRTEVNILMWHVLRNPRPDVASILFVDFGVGCLHLMGGIWLLLVLELSCHHFYQSHSISIGISMASQSHSAMIIYSSASLLTTIGVRSVYSWLWRHSSVSEHLRTGAVPQVRKL